MNGCVIAPGYTMPNGYVRATESGRRDYAHRVAYIRAFGPIPEGLEIDHLCRTRNCVNPDHLEAVSHKENLKRGRSFSSLNASKTHCPQGHPYDEANTYRRPDRPSRRDCLTCRKARHQKTRP